MTIDHDDRRPHPSHPPGAAAPARPRRGADHRRLLGASARRSTAPRPSPTSSTGWSARAGSPTSTSPRPAPLPDGPRGAASSPTPRSTSSSRPWRGRSAAPTTRRSRRGSARSSRRVAAAQEADGYLNTSFGRPGQAPAVVATSSGATSCTASGTCSRPRWPGPARGPTPTTACVDVGPARGRPRLRRRSGPTASRAVCGHAEIEVGARRAGPGDGRAALPRAGARCSSSAAAPARSRDIEWGRAYFQDDVPVRDADGRCAATRCGPTTSRPARSTSPSRPATPSCSHALDAPVGEHGRPAHLHDRRPGLAPPGRGVRRGLGAAAGPRLLRDLCGRRLGHVQLAAAARPGRAALRRPDRAHALQRRRDLAVARRAPRSTTPTRCTSAAGHRARRRRRASPRASSSLRAPWFEVSCCPPNVARTLASLAGYVATADDDGHAAAPVRARRRSARRLATAATVALDVETALPAQTGSVRVRRADGCRRAVDAHAARAGAGRRARDRVRIRRRPTWRPGRSSPASAAVTRAFRAGDVVELDLPMTPAVHRARPARRRRARLRRGRARPRGARPRVGRSRRDGRWRAPTSPTCGSTTRSRRAMPARRARRARRGVDASGIASSGAIAEVPLVRYHEWAERGPSQMRVWVPTVDR